MGTVVEWILFKKGMPIMEVEHSFQYCGSFKKNLFIENLTIFTFFTTITNLVGARKTALLAKNN